MAHLYPNFRNNPAYFQSIFDFRRKYIKTYVENRDLPEYTVNMVDFESTFLVYLPTQDLMYKSPECLHPIIYMEKIGEDSLEKISTYRYFLFEYEQKPTQEIMSKEKEPYILYDKLITISHRTTQLLEDEPFDSFNPLCVFQLQPEHYHYFASYFKDFEPFIKKMMAYDAQRFKSSVVPKNLL